MTDKSDPELGNLETATYQSDDEDFGEKNGSVGGSNLTGSSDLSEKRDIFLHMEVLDGTQHRVAQLVWFVLICCGIALCALCIYFKTQPNRQTEYMQSGILFKLDTAFAVLCLSLLLPMLSWFLYRFWMTRTCQWTRRQRYLVAVAFLELLFQTVNVLFWLIPNAYLLVNKCSFFDGLVDACTYIRWTCWNTVFFLQLVHVQNCKPVLKTRKDEDPWPDYNNPRYGYNDRDPMCLDGSFWRTHWISMIYWCIFEASIIYLAASGGIDWIEQARTKAPSFCPTETLHEYPGLKYTIIHLLWGSGIFIYNTATQAVLRRALAKLQSQPYNAYKLGNLLLLWQRRQTIWMEMIGLVEVGNIYFSYKGLNSYFLQWTGQQTLQVLITGGAVLNAFYFLPMEPSNEEHIYQVWLQEFAWTTEQIPKRQRALLKRSPTMGPRLQEKPMFCFETALKLLLWSNLVYEYTEEEGGQGLAEPVQAELEAGEQNSEESDLETGLRKAADREADSDENQRRRSSGSSSGSSSGRTPDLEKSRLENGSRRRNSVSERNLTADGLLKDEKSPQRSKKVDTALSGKEQVELAMQMFKLDQLKVIHGPVTDTKVVIGWSSEAMVLAFRGTSSLANMRSDAKAWRNAHLPRRGHFWLGTMPLVHNGFLQAWYEVSEQVLQHVEEVLAAAAVPPACFRVYLTGHSLGGALATLAAFDIQASGALPGALPNLACYTIGAPRTGNKAFADEFNRLCPDCWHLINDRDAVPRTGKLLWMYKRPGERVLLSRRGDIRVRPNVFEINLHTRGFSVKQHLLTAYLEALGSICVAQLFKYKRVDGGYKGVLRLSESPEIRKLLGSIGVDLKEALKHPPPQMGLKKKGRRCGIKGNLVDVLRDMYPFVPDD